LLRFFSIWKLGPLQAENAKEPMLVTPPPIFRFKIHLATSDVPKPSKRYRQMLLWPEVDPG
jgi:hypothetical protein